MKLDVHLAKREAQGKVKTRLHNVVRVLIAEYLAPGDGSIVLVPGDKRAVFVATPRERRQVVYRCKHVEARAMRLAQECDLAG